MKKFDYFLLFIAVGLLSFGYYFSNQFTTEYDNKNGFKKITSINKVLNNKLRIPNQIDNKSKKQNSKKIMNSGFNKTNILENEFISKFVYFKNCIKKQDCDFSQEDPRSYELEIYQAMNQHLKSMDMLSAGLKEKVLLSAAREPDGYVKETALKALMEAQIYSEKWRDVVLDEYIGQFNSRLIPDAMAYLNTFSSESDKVIINLRIVQELATGSPMVANALTDNLKIFLDKSSLDFYKNQLSNLEEGPIKKNLKREIHDFEMVSTAG